MDTDAGLAKMAKDMTSRLFGKRAKVPNTSMEEMTIAAPDVGKTGHTYVDEVRQPFYSPACARVQAG